MPCYHNIGPYNEALRKKEIKKAELEALKNELKALTELLETLTPIPDKTFTVETKLSNVNELMKYSYKNDGMTIDGGKIEEILADTRCLTSDADVCIELVNEAINTVNGEIEAVKKELEAIDGEIAKYSGICSICAAAAAAAAAERKNTRGRPR